MALWFMLACLPVSAQAQTTDLAADEAAYGAAAAALLDEAPFDGVHWGVLIREVESHRMLLSLNEGRKFAPASNMKLLTTSGAVIALGMDYRYETPVLVRGVLDKRLGEVDGDLVVVGSGDPTWSSRFFADSVTGPLSALVDSLVDVGVRRVTGSLVIDASAWDSTTVRPSWMVGDMGESYGSTGGAFAVDEGALRLEVKSGDVGTAPKVSRLGMGSDLGRLDRKAVAVLVPDSTDELRIEYKPGTERFLLTGGILKHSVDTLEVAVRHPVEIAGELLLALLEERGILVAEGLRVEWPSEGAEEATTPEVAMKPIVEDGHEVLFVMTSPPLSEIIQAILEPSQNWIADQLLKTLGAVRGEGGGWSEGERVLKELLVAKIGADTMDIDIRDGSGLSAYNLVTPRVLDALLSYMWTIPESTVYRDALPAPGEEGSTLESRLEDLEGRLYAKTGTITHATSLSGYVQADSGKWLSFVILSNGSGLESSLVRERIDELVRLTATVH